MPRFPSLAELESDPLAREDMQRARRVDFILEPGDVLFVPQGTPHEVANVTRTVAVSANFWDQSNVASGVRRMAAKLARRSEDQAGRSELEQTMRALSDMPWPRLEEDLMDQDGDARSGEDMVGSLGADGLAVTKAGRR